MVDVVLGLFGKTFSTEDEAGETTQVWAFSPASCALSALMGLAGLPSGACVGFKKLHASTKLFVGPAPATDVGMVSWFTSPTVRRRASKLANQKSLSLIMRPPAVAPNCSMVAGVTPQDCFQGNS